MLVRRRSKRDITTCGFNIIQSHQMELQPRFTLHVSDRREKEPINQGFEQDQGPSTCLEHDNHEVKEIRQVLVDIQGVATRTMITIDNAT
jgi:hypothetical protein